LGEVFSDRDAFVMWEAKQIMAEIEGEELDRLLIRGENVRNGSCSDDQTPLSRGKEISFTANRKLARNDFFKANALCHNRPNRRLAFGQVTFR
jgi:hypothetical protein